MSCSVFRPKHNNAEDDDIFPLVVARDDGAAK